MKTRFFALKNLALLLVLAFCAVPGHTKDLLQWPVFSWPPLYILAGDLKGQGRYDRLRQHWQAELPQYEHQDIEMNWARFWVQIQTDGQRVCNPLSIPTPEREKIAYFSKPIVFGLPNRIIARRDVMAKLGNPKQYSLVTLLNYRRFTGGIENGRSLGASLDKLIEAQSAQGRIVKLSNSSTSILRMASAMRLDYVIDYGSVMAFAENHASPIPLDLSSAAITELPEYTWGAMACPKNAWGKKVIDDVNAMLTRTQGSPTYRQYMELWQDPESKEKIREIYDIVFKIAPPPGDPR